MYHQILFNFSTYEDDNELYFNDRTEAKKAVDYLNEVYSTMFKLME